MKVLLEACVTLPEEAVAAVRAGAVRLELCRNLEVGGLTPGVPLVEATLEALSAGCSSPVPVFCMVRARPGRFTSDPGSLGMLAADVRRLLVAGASGVVLGFLDARGFPDREALAPLLEAAGTAPVTFHRAFDLVPDPVEALEMLAELGVQRVLTAGGRGTAWEGRRVLRELVEASATGGPVILGGGGIRADHAAELLRETRLAEIHARAQAFPELAEALRRGT